MEIIDKIFTENRLLDNSSFVIVEDKFPICQNHLLAFCSNRSRSSMMKHPDELMELFNDVGNYFDEPFYFFERGNASFCTSINGPFCAHLHFFPKSSFKSSLLHELIIDLEPIKLNTTSNHNNKKEYFLFGDQYSLYYKELDTSPPKRYLRNFFKSRVK